MIDSAAADAVDQIRKAADGGVLGVVDFVSARSTAQLAIDVLANGGELVIVGLIGGDITLPLPMLAMREIGLQGFFTGSLAELKDWMTLVDRARPKSIPINCRPLCEANHALEDLRDGKAIGRLVLTP